VRMRQELVTLSEGVRIRQKFVGKGVGQLKKVMRDMNEQRG
jgi:hypothetical protein